jgi:hypothetical protein
MRRYLVTRKKTVTVTLTGTSGTANINIGGTNYLATFNTDLTTTGSDFVTASAATILAAKGVVVTAALGVLTFKANIGGVSFVTPTIINATGNLAGTVAQTKAQTNYELFSSGLDVNGGGNISIFQIKDRDAGVFIPEAEKIKRLNYHEGELITIAAAENFTLTATANDGSGAVSKNAEV